jgi:hypothetical protein
VGDSKSKTFPTAENFEMFASDKTALEGSIAFRLDFSSKEKGETTTREQKPLFFCSVTAESHSCGFCAGSRGERKWLENRSREEERAARASSSNHEILSRLPGCLLFIYFIFREDTMPSS